LDIQKELNIDQLSEREVHGRWKSFIYKWYAFLYHQRIVAKQFTDKTLGTAVSLRKAGTILQ
jgi:hypothetical protein